ncbi:hypothetical protein HOLleu_01245 [Holothuria leucospilota]|uniref:Helitron helicase-like domain-containing protein n=1 Tax=Holothuria leucospilota TaxID=206669 RepID=A0A9Q1CPP4_HOLLE|nr:hypothetical protein HOLleu_01245 [Holothuria leucospilota]
MCGFILSEAAPLGIVTAHFHVIEFQARGSPHTHGFLWVKGSPVFDEDSDKDICEFIDKYITCSKQATDNNAKALVERFQTHHIPPVAGNTERCLVVFCFQDLQTVKLSFQGSLRMTRMNQGCTGDLSEILKSAHVSKETYESALKISSHGSTIVLKRDLNEVWINNYNLELLQTSRANIDVQFILDPYACIMYIVSYMIKGENCVGDLLKAAAKECNSGDVKTQMKKVAAAFKNSREVSAQEAVYRQLSMPLKRSSRQVVFINTNPKDKRVAMLKRKDVIDKMEDDEDFFQTSLLDRYQARPDSLEDVTLAEFTASYRPMYTKSVTSQKQQDSSGRKLHLKHGLGMIAKRQKDAVIRYQIPNITKHEEEFFRTLLMLYLSWREEAEMKGTVLLTWRHLNKTEKL